MRLPLLISYHYHRKHDPVEWLAQFPVPPLLLLDSGAYSAMTQGFPIDVHEYATWLKRWTPYAMAYANLDVIRNPEATWAHQRILEDDYGFAPLPVFHVAEEWSWLDHYADRYDYVALGVAGNHRRTADTPVYWSWLVRCFHRVQSKGVRLHGFGISNVGVVNALPFYSVDSSSWGASYRYGEMRVWDRGRMVTFNKRRAYEHAALIRRYGVDPGALMLDGDDRTRQSHRTPLTVLATHSCLAWTDWLRERHGVQAQPTHPATGVDGPLVFMVDASPVNELLLGEAAASYVGTG